MMMMMVMIVLIRWRLSNAAFTSIADIITLTTALVMMADDFGGRGGHHRREVLTMMRVRLLLLLLIHCCLHFGFAEFRSCLYVFLLRLLFLLVLYFIIPSLHKLVVVVAVVETVAGPLIGTAQQQPNWHLGELASTFLYFSPLLLLGALFSCSLFLVFFRPRPL